MTVKEILEIACTFVNRLDVKEHFSSGNGSDEVAKEAGVFIDLLNVVVNELACTYVPMITSEDVSATGGRIFYKDLKEKALKIIKVTDRSNAAVDYKYAYQYITVDQSFVTVFYEYSPKKVGIDDEVGYLEKDVPARVIAYGVAAEYLLVNGDFDEAVTWHKRYTDAIAALCLPKNKKAAGRLWA
ncbi:MAG: hypothetical protein IJC72_00050 [Clostridia bacterium]|nr:hypothetical protein [Clostridia bacterium]